MGGVWRSLQAFATREREIKRETEREREEREKTIALG